MSVASLDRSPRLPKPAPAGFLTSEEFLNWLEPGIHADLVGGEILMHSPVSLKHAALVNFLDHLLRSYLEEVNLGVLHRETVAVRLSVRETFLPDLAYFTSEQAARLRETHAPFAPSFVVEVVSPSTVEVDRTRKFASYELHGVQEYWLLDPEKHEHQFYRRAGDMFVEFAKGSDRIDSACVPGFWVRRAWLSASPHPRVSSCLGEILNKPKARSSRRRR